MNNRFNSLIVVLITVFSAISSLAHAQAAWHKTVMSDDGKVDKNIVAISIPAEAEYGGKKMKASVFIFEHIESGKSGVPVLGIYIENVHDIIPDKELSMFIGPDIPNNVQNGSTFEMSVNLKSQIEKIVTYPLYGDSKWYDPGFECDGYFALAYLKGTRERWKKIVTDMSGGFMDAGITIGGTILPHKLHIHFSGAGLSSQLRDLMQYCEK